MHISIATDFIIYTLLFMASVKIYCSNKILLNQSSCSHHLYDVIKPMEIFTAQK